MAGEAQRSRAASLERLSFPALEAGIPACCVGGRRCNGAARDDESPGFLEGMLTPNEAGRAERPERPCHPVGADRVRRGMLVAGHATTLYNCDVRHSRL